MPIYEWSCPRCHLIFSDLRSVGHYDAVCPKCKKEGKIIKMHKLISLTIVDFNHKIISNNKKQDI